MNVRVKFLVTGKEGIMDKTAAEMALAKGMPIKVLNDVEKPDVILEKTKKKEATKEE